MLLECCYISMESSQWENWNYLFGRKVSFLTGPHCQFRGVGEGMKQICIIKMVESLIDIFVMFGGCVFQQTVGIPVGTKFTPLLVDLFINFHVGHFFLWNTVGLILLICLIVLSGNNCVEGREVECSNDITWWDVPWLYVLNQIFESHKTSFRTVLQSYCDISYSSGGVNHTKRHS
jgi:hypothetical protein